MGHLLDHSGKSRFDKTPKEWLKVGSQINEVVNEWAKRSDIVTFVGEGAGAGHAACFVPALAEMEVNVEKAFDGSSAAVIPDLTDRNNQFDYPVAMGAVLHEAMHARHSTLDLLLHIRDEKDPTLRMLATAMEETRIEARGIAHFPKNRSFLRACALKLVIGDIQEDEDFAERGMVSFSHLMLLTLARVDAGVLDMADVKPIKAAADKLFDRKTYNTLRDLWKRAQKHNVDKDGTTLIALAREWVKALEESGHDMSGGGEEIPEWLKELLKAMAGAGGGKSEPGEDGEESKGSGGEGEGEDGEGEGENPLEAMARAAEESARDEANEQAVNEILQAIAEKRDAEANEAKTHRDAAGEVYGRGTGPGGGYSHSRLIKERDPKPEERAAAVALGKAFEKARYRDRVMIESSSIIPPGRMNGRKAVAAAEQRSRGAQVTAEAWERKIRKHTEDPTLTVGMLVDISGSMYDAMEPMASATWILSEATRRVQGKCSAVYYGNDVFSVLRAGQHFKKVNVYDAPDGTEKFDKAFKALDGHLNLLNGSGARLLVIVSDLHYTGFEMSQTQMWMARCRKAGIAVLVIPFGYDATAKVVLDKVGNGVELITNARTSKGVVEAAKAIGEAAIKNLAIASS